LHSFTSWFEHVWFGFGACYFVFFTVNH
jgi:hypothetical protein